ncbi:MAG: prepilin-type N-terminal cleavage/methylation domain-containing protein [Patescibacteria group bacterium]|nr:prepilin-type N-terminal cleavage/methylation domain-containing protein [Patescibacteria group bacterium]
MKKGFTLIELLVTMAVIAILSSVLFLGRTGQEEKLALQRSAFQLVQHLREVQEMAMAGQEASCNGSKTYTFGLYFHKIQYPNSYLLFADCNGNQRRDGSDKILKELKLEKGVKVYDLSPSPLNLAFSPPDPVTYIERKNWGEEAVITLSLQSSESQQKKVKINTAGRIEIE